MTGAAALSYGRLLNTALLELTHALSGPARLPHAGDAILVAQARHRIYRTASRLMQACVAGLERAGVDRAARLTLVDRRAAARLQSLLASSVTETAQVMAMTGSRPAQGSIAGRLARAADAAGLAWDLLAAGLTAEAVPLDAAGAWVSQPAARAALSDAVLLARGMASLDARLAAAISIAAVDRATPQHVRQPLRVVAQDCETTTALGIAIQARDLVHRLAVPVTAEAWQRLDATIPVPAPPPPGPLTSATQAADAADRYTIWLTRHAGDLTVPDLSSLAATASRLTRLVVMNPARVSAEPAIVHNAVLAWYRAYHQLRPLRSITPRPGGWRQPFRIADWADQQPAGVPRTDPAWPQSVARIARLLPALAEAGEEGLARLQAAWQLLAPVEFPGRYPYMPAQPHQTTAAIEAFTAARRASTALADPQQGVAVPTHRPSNRQPSPSIPDRSDSTGRGVRIGTRSGQWEIRWDSTAGTYTTSHRTTGGPSTHDSRLRVGPGAIHTIGDLEQSLGFALPAAARSYLEANHTSSPPAAPRRASGLAATDTGSNHSQWTEQTRPTPDSPLRVPGQPDTTYGQALSSRPTLRSWDEDGYRIEIVAAASYTDPDTHARRHRISYRLAYHGRVIFSGDDVAFPDHVEPTSDDAIRAVAELLTLGTAEPANLVQKEFLRGHADLLNAYIQTSAPHFPDISLESPTPSLGFGP